MIFTLITYLCVVLAIGVWSHRRFKATGDDYFLASRQIGPFVLLMSLFGTNMTSFAILGSSAKAYHSGITVFMIMATTSALVIPLIFGLLGPKVWQLGKDWGFRTQAGFVKQRFQSPIAGLLFFFIAVLLMIPYLLIGIMGGGITLQSMTHGEIPFWVGALLISGITLLYVALSGLRGTAWVNTFQTLVFGSLGVIAFFVIVHKLGGLEPAMAKLEQVQPKLFLREGPYLAMFLSYFLVPVSAGAFPHLFQHWLSTKSAQSFKMTVTYYPLCMAVVWVPPVILGMLGHLQFPGLLGPQSNSILVDMVAHYAPGVLGGLLAAGVIAAIMSSLDSQSLALGSMFTHDILPIFKKQKLTQKQEVFFGRLFVVLVIAIAFSLSLLNHKSIFKLGVWCFAGFASLTPLMIAGIYWDKLNKGGALAHLFTLVTVWSLSFFNPPVGVGLWGTGFQPIVIIFLSSTLAMFVGHWIYDKVHK